MDETAGSGEAAKFLKALTRELRLYVPTLRQYLKANARYMPLSGRLALESGVRSYETFFRWSRSAFAKYKKRGKRGTRR
jgi:hypothetical protein